MGKLETCKAHRFLSSARPLPEESYLDDEDHLPQRTYFPERAQSPLRKKLVPAPLPAAASPIPPPALEVQQPSSSTAAVDDENDNTTSPEEDVKNTSGMPSSSSSTEFVEAVSDRASPTTLKYTGDAVIPITSVLEIIKPQDDTPRGIWPVFRLMVGA